MSGFPFLYPVWCTLIVCAGMQAGSSISSTSQCLSCQRWVRFHSCHNGRKNCVHLSGWEWKHIYDFTFKISSHQSYLRAEKVKFQSAFGSRSNGRIFGVENMCDVANRFLAVEGRGAKENHLYLCLCKYFYLYLYLDMHLYCGKYTWQHRQ